MINQTNKVKKVKQKRDILKLRKSEIKKLPKDFVANVNKVANLSWQVLNEQQLLQTVGKAYRNCVYNALFATRGELFNNYGIPYKHSLVGDEKYQDFDYSKLQLLGINRKRRKNDPNPKKQKQRSKDSYMFTIKDVELVTTDNDFDIKTHLDIDEYIRINNIKPEHIVYHPGHQNEAGVTLWNQIFVPSVFPIKGKYNKKTVYMFRIKTSPHSPNLWTNTEKLKANDIYQENHSFAHSYYEKNLKQQGSFESKLSCYAFARIGSVIHSVVDKHIDTNFQQAFIDLWYKNIDYKIKKVMDGRALHQKYPFKYKKK